MQDKTLKFLVARFAPALSNTPAINDEADEDAAEKYEDRGPKDIFDKLSKRIKSGKPFHDSDEQEEKDEHDDPDKQTWNPEGGAFAAFARVIKEGGYDWYVWNSDKKKKIATTNGKRTAVLQKGVAFGMREATSGKAKASGMLRVVVEEHGPTIVFSLPAQVGETLKANSRKQLMPVARRAKELTAPVKKKTSRSKTKAEVQVYTVEAASIRDKKVMDTVCGIFKKAGLTLDSKDPVKVKPSSNGTRVEIVSTHSDITFKKLMRLRAYMTHYIKASDVKFGVGASGSKMTITYYITVKSFKKDGEGNEKHLTRRGARVEPEKKATKKVKKPKLLKVKKSKKFKVSAAAARIHAYGQKRFGNLPA